MKPESYLQWETHTLIVKWSKRPLTSLCTCIFVASHGRHFKSQMNVENRQAHTLFGVAALFVGGHILRILLNLHEMFSLATKVENATGDDDRDCAPVPWPLTILVRRKNNVYNL
jgi:hypothetical protein